MTRVRSASGFIAARAAFVLALTAGFWLVFDCPVSFWLG